MSKILQQETQFRDIDIVRQALEICGYSPVYDEGYTERVMQGYAGQTFQANLGVTRANFTQVSKLSTYGDLGFKNNADGSVGFTGDDLLMGTSGFKTAMGKITASYSEILTTNVHRNAGFVLQSRNVQADGQVALEFVQTGTI